MYIPRCVSSTDLVRASPLMRSLRLSPGSLLPASLDSPTMPSHPSYYPIAWITRRDCNFRHERPIDRRVSFGSSQSVVRYQ